MWLSKKNKQVLAVLAASVLIYFCIILLLQLSKLYSNTSFIQLDTYSYIDAAKQLYLQHSLHATRPAGIALIYGFPLLFDASFTHFIEWAWCMNCVFWFGGLVLFYVSARTVLSNRMAIIVTLIFASHVSGIVFTSALLSESPFLFIVQLCLYVVVKYMHTLQLKHVSYLFIFLLIGIFIRPSLLIAFYGIGLMLVYFFYKKKYWQGILVLLCCNLLLHSYCLQMKQQYGTYTLSLIGKAALEQYITIRAKQVQNNTSYTQEIEKLFAENKDSNSTALKHNFRYQVQHYPQTILAAFCWNAVDNSCKGNAFLHANLHDTSKPWRTPMHSFFHFISMLQNMICSLAAVLGLFIIHKIRKSLPKHIKYLLQIIIVFCLYTMAISALSFYQHDRFHFVFAPLIYLFIATLIYYVRMPLSSTLPTRSAP
jgi:hypothetical protein